MVYTRDKGMKQYRGASGSEVPSYNPKNGWKKGQKYKTITGHVYIIDAVDVIKGNRPNSGEIKLYATRIK